MAAILTVKGVLDLLLRTIKYPIILDPRRINVPVSRELDFGAGVLVVVQKISMSHQNYFGLILLTSVSGRHFYTWGTMEHKLPSSIEIDIILEIPKFWPGYNLYMHL